ncbi:hypothetical protein [Halocatena pleomorpha]|uniref:Uncharacterized protein n=1 Tax=Halocatena pleomorpha TaxID=1785090 RepID=A0A3P3RB69_9EURY|nr:hypothetical protein [Halocatena pleomorpha]RRJ30644.1 hypothetical protein EIK79_09185 [Halocatena pleomorpha]
MSSDRSSQGITSISVLSLVIGIGSFGLAIERNGIYFLYTILQTVTGVSLWYRSHWGWYLGMFAYGIGAVYGIYAILTSSSGYINLIFNSIILYILYRRKID